MESWRNFFLSVLSSLVAVGLFDLAFRLARFFIEYRKHDLQEFHCYMYDEIEWATKRFSRPIGTAFWGKMHGGNEVAVTLVARDRALGDQGFRDKARLLSQMQHENLVRILGYGLGTSQDMLIHELMHYGSLEEVIDNNGTQPPLRLDWSRRLQIAADAAKGIEYIHTRCAPRADHGVVNSSNILIDKGLRAKVLVLLRAEDHDIARPEENVYGFGVVLLELITGQRAGRGSTRRDTVVNWVRSQTGEEGPPAFMDHAIIGHCSIKSIEVIVDIAFKCLIDVAKRRPTISEALREIEWAIFEEGNYRSS